MRTSLLALLMVSAPILAILPTASACTYTPIVTVGSPTYPNTGVYAEQGCYSSNWGPYGPAQIRGSDRLSSYPTGVCEFVPAVFVGTTQVPGTGQNYCGPSNPVPQQFAIPLTGLPDDGVAVCAVIGCTWVATYTLTYYCVTLGVGTGTITLPTGDQISVQCTTT